MKILGLITFLFPFLVFSQVGINTTNPLETLHVNGTARVDNIVSTTSTELMGADATGTLNTVTVGTNLSLTGGTLNSFGAATYGIATITVAAGTPNQVFDDIDLGVNGINQDKTVFRLVGRTSNYQFSGIAGGTDGRHIILLNIPAVNFRLNDEDAASVATNRILTLAAGFESTTGQGTAELVYDGTLQRWLLISFRN